MTFVIFNDEYRALILCGTMGMLNFMELICLCA